MMTRVRRTIIVVVTAVTYPGEVRSSNTARRETVCDATRTCIVRNKRTTTTIIITIIMTITVRHLNGMINVAAREVFTRLSRHNTRPLRLRPRAIIINDASRCLTAYGKSFFRVTHYIVVTVLTVYAYVGGKRW